MSDSSRAWWDWDGFFLGSVIGALMVGGVILSSSPADFHNTPKIYFLIAVVAVGIVGALFGKTIVMILAEIFRWL